MPDAAPQIATNLRRIRHAHQWSVEDVAAMSGLDRSLIEGIEHGRSFLSRRSMAQLAERLQVPVDELTGPA